MSVVGSYEKDMINQRKKLLYGVGLISCATLVSWTSLCYKTMEMNKNSKIQCQPVKRIGFMKTHKTASSTVQSVLFRFGIENGLNFVLPAPTSGNVLNDPKHPYSLIEPFKTKWLVDQKLFIPWHSEFYKQKKYDIFNLHTIWNKSAVRDLLGNDALFITILRHPVDLFESLYTYYSNLELNMNLHQYIERLNTTEFLYKKRMMKYLGLNQQLYDLGLSLNDLYNITAAQEKIKEIDDDFDLVLISEDFDKSMVLLANKLCWPLDHVKSFKLNARKNSTKITLNEQERDILQSWQKGDMLLYNHFQNKLEREINLYGKNRMEQDLKKLQGLKKSAKERCIMSESDRAHMNQQSLYRPWSPEVIGYNINQNDDDCKLLTMAEMPLVNLARDRQNQRWKNSTKLLPLSKSDTTGKKVASKPKIQTHVRKKLQTSRKKRNHKYKRI